MKTIQVAELGPLAEDIRNGETIAILDGERLAALIVPAGMPDETVQELFAAWDREHRTARPDRISLP